MAGENPQTTMPPVPREPLIDGKGQMSNQWMRWMQQIQRILSFAGGIAWQIINKAGSKLSDIETRPHEQLTDVEGWEADVDVEQTKHISNADGKVWQDHVETVDGNPHGTDHDQLEGIDTDESTSAIHHTLGQDENQAASGNDRRLRKADRVWDVVIDFGADNTGVTAIDAAFAEAQTTASAGDTIIVPQGKYRMAARFTMDKRLNWQFSGYNDYDAYGTDRNVTGSDPNRSDSASTPRLTWDDIGTDEGSVFYLDPATFGYDSTGYGSYFSAFLVTVPGVRLLGGFEVFASQPDPALATFDWTYPYANTYTPNITPYAVEVRPAVLTDPDDLHAGRIEIESIMIRNLSHGLMIHNGQFAKIGKVRGQVWRCGIYVKSNWHIPHFDDVQFHPAWSNNSAAREYQSVNAVAVIDEGGDGTYFHYLFALGFRNVLKQRPLLLVGKDDLGATDTNYDWAGAASHAVMGAVSAGKRSWVQVQNLLADSMRAAVSVEGWVDQSANGHLLHIDILSHSNVSTGDYPGGETIAVNEYTTNCVVQVGQIAYAYASREIVKIEGTGNLVNIGLGQFNAWSLNVSGAGPYYAINCGTGNTVMLGSGVKFYSVTNQITGGGSIIRPLSPAGSVDMQALMWDAGASEFVAKFPLANQYNNDTSTTIADPLFIYRTNASLSAGSAYTAFGVENDGQAATPHASASVQGAIYTGRYSGSGTLSNLVGFKATARTSGGGTVTLAEGIQFGLYSSAGSTITNGRTLSVKSPNVSSGGTVTNDYGIYIEPRIGTNEWGIYQEGAELNSFGGMVESRSGGFKLPDGTVIDSADDITYTQAELLDILDDTSANALLLVGSSATTKKLVIANSSLQETFSLLANGQINLYDQSATPTQVGVWDSQNKRLGLGITSPRYALDVTDGASTSTHIHVSTSTADDGLFISAINSTGAIIANGAARSGTGYINKATTGSIILMNGSTFGWYATSGTVGAACTFGASFEITATGEVKINGANSVGDSGKTPDGGDYVCYTAGEDLVAGDVVCFLYNSGNADTVNKTPTSNDRAIGIVSAGVSSGAVVKVVTRGRVATYFDSAPLKGSIALVDTAAAGRATSSNAPDASVAHWREIGHPTGASVSRESRTLYFIDSHFN